MNVSEISGILAGVIFAISAGWYTIDVARGKVVASIATFAMFTLINISLLVSLIAKHVWHVVPFQVVGTVTSILICVFALKNKKIYFELADKIGLAGAFLGGLLWIITKDATANLIMISAVNIVIFLPLIIKSFKRADLETVPPWRINLLASFFLMLTINSTAPSVWVVPARQFLCSLLLNIGLFYSGRRVRSNLKSG